MDIKSTITFHGVMEHIVVGLDRITLEIQLVEVIHGIGDRLFM